MLVFGQDEVPAIYCCHTGLRQKLETVIYKHLRWRGGGVGLPDVRTSSVVSVVLEPRESARLTDLYPLIYVIRESQMKMSLPIIQNPPLAERSVASILDTTERPRSGLEVART